MASALWRCPAYLGAGLREVHHSVGVPLLASNSQAPRCSGAADEVVARRGSSRAGWQAGRGWG